MISNPTRYFPRLLPGTGTIPARRGSPDGCSEQTLQGTTRRGGRRDG